MKIVRFPFMLRAFCIIVGVIGLSSCTQKMVCPAYQSAFIFDKPTAREKFVYYNEDTVNTREVLASNGNTITLPVKPIESKYEVMPGPSLPKAKTVKRDRYLLMPRKTYQKALRSLMTVEMKPVYPKKIEDDSAMSAQQLANIIRDENDTSLATRPQPKGDSVYVISKAREKFNVEQDNYLWYFRDVLVLPDVRLAMEGAKEEKANAKGGGKSGKKKVRFFKNLFGKKKKAKADSTYMTDLNSTDYPKDSTQQNSPKKKKGFNLNPFKKKKVDSATPAKPQQPAKKEEEDDGF